MPLSLGPGHAAALTAMQPSASWGDGSNLGYARQQPQLDRSTAKEPRLACGLQTARTPAYCLPGSDHPSAKAIPIKESLRQAAVVGIRRPASTRHSTPASERTTRNSGSMRTTPLVQAGGGDVLGWINTKMLTTATGDIVKSQGWTPFILDTNGNGKRALRPECTRRIQRKTSGSMPASTRSCRAGGRIDLGCKYAATRRGRSRRRGKESVGDRASEIYNVPAPGFGVRGGDIGSKGVVWCRSRATSQQMQGCTQRTKGGNGRSVPRGLDVLQVSGAGLRRRSATTAQRRAIAARVNQHNTSGLGAERAMKTTA